MVRPLTILNVAEKNSVAREVTRILCNGRPDELNSCATYCKNFKFPFNLNGQSVDMIFSSVAGHLLELEFTDPYNSWRGCTPGQLYSAPVAKQVSKGEGEKIKRNLQQLARRSQWLILWLDCDREGENIAFEVIEVCQEVNPQLIIKRARFSALIQRDIFHAINNLVEPNPYEAAAVDARQEIDLRIGSSFTRLQTLLLQDKFDWTQHLTRGRDRMLISYGPCQFPTLGLIVQREWEIQSHVNEPFWTMKVQYSASGSDLCEFEWSRGRIFDRSTAELYHGICTRNNPIIATVIDVSGRETRRYAPAPLCTLEMQKKASQSLRLSGERIMKLAEELYQGGFISYPRTETNLFATGYDLQRLIAQHTDTGMPWSTFAQRLVNQPGAQFRQPKNGGKDDGAHPPIHPTRHYAGDDNHDKKRLYEFIVRHFLACCAPDAIGRETKVNIEVANEIFTVTGLMVVARNWLDVYPYTNWTSQTALPVFIIGQTFQPSRIVLNESMTQPPPRLSESDLLSKMDMYGIGTDATVADHIAKQIERGYAIKNENLTFSPTSLGEALISAYRKMNLGNLWMPTLRGLIEKNITAVARGQRSKDEVLTEAIQAFAADFLSAMNKSGILIEEVKNIVFNGSAENNNTLNALGDTSLIGTCLCAAGNLVLVPAQDGHGPIVRCTAPAVLHGQSKELPARTMTSATVSEETCHRCQCKKLNLQFNRVLMPPAFQHMASCTCCVVCDNQLAALLEILGGSQIPLRASQRHNNHNATAASSHGISSRQQRGRSNTNTCVRGGTRGNRSINRSRSAGQ